jgi:sterol 3beta-glucosyltransferase
VTATMGGSRGEARPYVALGLGLETAGHEVCVATQTSYEGFVRGRG